MKRSLGSRTLLYPTPVLVVGTYDEAGRPNVMTAAWGGVVNSKPASVGVAVRKERATYDALVARGAFTVSLPDRAHADAANYIGTVSGRTVDKFAATGLTPQRAEFVDAPFVAEFPLALECAVTHAIDLGSHTLFIGEVKDVKIDEGALGPDGSVDVEALAPLIYAPGPSSYYTFGEEIGTMGLLGKGFTPVPRA